VLPRTNLYKRRLEQVFELQQVELDAFTLAKLRTISASVRTVRQLRITAILQ